jgi:nitrite reductase (NO-forming)
VMVDHHFANASQGAIGIIDAGGPPEEKGDIEHHNIAATATPTDPAAVKGKQDFESKCLACHSVGGGRKLGPDLFGVSKRRDDKWLAQWLKSPEAMLKSDPTAQAMLKEYNNIPMPNQNLSDAEVSQYIRYFHWIDEESPRAHAQGAPKVSAQPSQPTAGGTPAPAAKGQGK